MSTDATANAASAKRRPVRLSAIRWKANPAPRSTIPSAARQSGMNSVDITDANASGNPVQRMTSAKISQTWFASQTGPIAQSMRARARFPRSLPPATSAQNPDPKSAPPNTA